jgi:hypothetical protein
VETFTIGLRNLWWLRLCSRNPLVRRIDRIESVVLGVAVLLIALAIPIAGAIGTSVSEQRARLYIQEAQTKHQVIATAIDDGTVGLHRNKVVFTAEATWSMAGEPRAGDVEWSGRPGIGAQQSIWIDVAGNRVQPPLSTNRAGGDALGIAVSVWLGVACASVGLVYVVRRGLDRRRDAEWDREIEASHHGDGRRNHQS